MWNVFPSKTKIIDKYGQNHLLIFSVGRKTFYLRLTEGITWVRFVLSLTPEEFDQNELNFFLNLSWKLSDIPLGSNHT